MGDTTIISSEDRNDDKYHHVKIGYQRQRRLLNFTFHFSSSMTIALSQRGKVYLWSHPSKREVQVCYHFSDRKLDITMPENDDGEVKMSTRFICKQCVLSFRLRSIPGSPSRLSFIEITFSSLIIAVEDDNHDF